jgi:hypothetical protein
MRYRVLMLSEKNPKSTRMAPGKLGPEKPLPPVKHPLTLAAMRKLVELVNAGATVAGARPVGPSSMDDDSATYHALADTLWGPRGAPQEGQVRHIGNGRVIPSLAAARDVLRRDGVAPDCACEGVSDGGFIDWIHRTSPEAEIYFVANREARDERVTVRFRDAGRTAEIWDAVTGETATVPTLVDEAGTVRVPLTLPPYASRFVIFRKSGTSAPPLISTGDPRAVATVSGPWQVSFDPAWGGPESAVAFDTLTDWTLRPEDGIKHYSGTAVYRTTFDCPTAATGTRQSVYLDLGSVQVVAEVTLNGDPLGTLWTAPWRLEVTRALKPGANALEIRVTNLWPNRLIGDASLPDTQRLTRTNLNKYAPEAPLLPSGLLGPVRLLDAP